MQSGTDTASASAPAASATPGVAPLAPRAGLWGNVRDTVRLALPVMLARSGTLGIITADVIMTGHFRAQELGFYGLGFMAHQALYVLCQGALLGVTVLASQADGMGQPQRSGTVWKVGLFYGALLGLLFGALSALAERFFLLTGQAPELAREGGAVTVIFALGLPPLLMYVATALYLEGISRPRANVWVMLAANALNVLLNWLLIYDHDFTSIGGQGAAGAALGTSLTRWFMCAALGGYVLLMRDRQRFGVRGRLHYPRDVGRKLRRLGLPLMVAQGLESAAFLTVILFVGWLGAQPLAVYQIANNLFNIVFMLALGLATATSVRVGNAVGRQDRVGLAWAGWSGAALGLAVLAALCIAFNAAPGLLASIYTSDAAVLERAAPVIAISGLFIVVDGGQAVLVGALRGVGDIILPSCMVVGGFWGVTVPLAYRLAVVQGWGVPGILWALIAGAGTATALLLLRFTLMARREVRPV